MHDDRELIERRITREFGERVLPLVHHERRAMSVWAGPTPDDVEPYEPGTMWGPPWGTTWFRLDGDVPSDWPTRTGSRVEALVDLGFSRAAAGFQCEGMVVEIDGERRLPVQGIHPMRTAFVVPAEAGPVTITVEAASNPTFPGFRPSAAGSPDTAGTAPLYRFRSADLVLVDTDAEALSHDVHVLDGLMRSLALTDPRRTRLRHRLAAALDALPDVASARRVLAAELEPMADDPRRHRIVATGHAHIDTAWLWPIRETRRKCARTFASAVRLMDDHPEYRFSVSQAQQYAWIEETHPELFAAIVERARRGQWIPVGGMWVEADMNLPSGESLARQIVVGQRYFTEHFGAPCTEMWIPDVFGYPAGLPQLFAAGGMTRFVTQKLSWNKQNRFPHHTFWWEGLDGTRVLTHFPPVDTYNGEITGGELVGSVERFREHAWSRMSLLPFGYGDGGGGPTREMLERARRLARIDPNATLEIGTPADFFDEVEREATQGAPVPVWRGELYFEMHRGTLTSQLRTKTGNRRCERLLVETELWAATLGDPNVPDGLDGLWREVLTQQFHDILPGSSIAWVHADAEAVFERVGAELDAHVAALLERATDAAVAPWWIANPADAAVDGVVVVRADPGHEPPDAVQVLGDGTWAVAVEATPLAVAPLEPATPAAPVVLSDSSMSNGLLAVRWDSTGAITSIIDVTRGRELLPVGQRAAVLELAADHPVEYDAWDLESWTRRQARPIGTAAGERAEIVVVDDGPLVGSVAVRSRFGPSEATVTYRLRAGDPQLDVHVALDWHHDEHLLSIAFPLDVRTDTASCDVQFGVVGRPTHPSSPWDAAKFEVCAHRYVDLAEPDFGVAILNDGRYGHGVFDGAVRVSLARAAKYPDPTADHGHHEVTLAVRAHGPGLVDVRAAAARLNAPVRLVRGGAGGRRADAAPGAVVEITGDGVSVGALKPADDGSGDLVVRLHEACGNRVATTVRARTRLGAAWRCDLMEEPQRAEDVADGIVALSLRPFELVTLRLRLVDDFDGR